MPAPPTAASWRERVVVAGLVVAVLGAALLVDPWAQAAFDAPKRLALLGGTLLAAVGLAGIAQPPRWREWTRTARGCLLLWLTALALTVLASACATAAVADGLRPLLVTALLLPLGAAPLLGTPIARPVVAAAAFGVGSNAVLSLLQGLGLDWPLPLAQIGGRYASGALLGNEGHVALASALTLPACAAVALRSASASTRRLAWLLGLLCLAAIALNRQATSLIAAGAGLVAITAVQFRARRLLAAGGLVLLLLVLSAAVPPLRAVSWAQLPLSTAQYQQQTTYRLGAWAAAEEMIRAQPLLGHGPGSFAAQAQPYRLAAEQRLQQRLAPPPPAVAFAQAHQDYLQYAAEAGLPALLALLVALLLLLRRLARIAEAPAAGEALALFGLLTAAAVAALAWFPLQIPLTAALVLLAAGRGWRLVAAARPPAAAPPAALRRGQSLPWLIGGLALLLLWPELPRYRGEWDLASANGRLERLLRGAESGDAALESAREAERLAAAAAARLPHDPRAALSQGIALILLQRGDAARDLFRAAIADGERPELLVNLGRAEAVRGDLAAAHRAYLRAAWASPQAIATLPRAMRESLLAEVAAREAALRAGRADALPAL